MSLRTDADPARTPVIVDGVRTPFGRYGGALASVRPDDLAATMFYLLGIDPETQVPALGNRPVAIAEGKPVMGVLA